MNERIKVRKANRTVRVTENELDRYLANGYSIVEQKQVSQPKVETPKAPVAEPADTVKTSYVKSQQTNKKRRNTK